MLVPKQKQGVHWCFNVYLCANCVTDLWNVFTRRIRRFYPKFTQRCFFKKFQEKIKLFLVGIEFFAKTFQNLCTEILFRKVFFNIRTWKRRICYMFPEIHLWCDTCWPLVGQQSTWVILLYIHMSRHRWSSKPGPIECENRGVLVLLKWDKNILSFRFCGVCPR